MDEKMIKEIAETMITKVRCFNLYKEQYKDNKRECPFYSELVGMEQVLKIMGVDFEYACDLETYEITALTIGDVVVRI